MLKQILDQCQQINDGDQYRAFFDLAGHINALSVTVFKAGTDHSAGFTCAGDQVLRFSCVDIADSSMLSKVHNDLKSLIEA